jgi:Zn-dependent alcohol dehydrogenase
MSVVIIQYEARCKHCLHCSTKKNDRNRRQAYCDIKKEFITLRDKACENLEL